MRRGTDNPILVRAAALGLLSLLGAPACAPPDDRPNFLLLSVDTLRADRLGAFGYERPTSPAMDAFAAESVVFQRAQTQAPWTFPSLASLVTGMPSTSHRCWTGRTRLDGVFDTLAEVLLRGGYDTLAVANHPFLSRHRGLQQGFVHYDEELTLRSPPVTSVTVSDKVVQLLEWKAGSTDGVPWFLWAHYLDPHDSYVTHEGISETFGTEEPSDVYDGEVRFTDRHLGRVLTRLDELGLAENTVVVFVTDHGEAFGDHGVDGHGHNLYEELIRSPLVIRAPGVEPRVVDQAVQAMDVLPTILELADLAPPAGVESRSLVPFLRGETPPPAPALSEVHKFGRELQRSVTLDGWKLIVNHDRDAYELYDLNQDALEAHDLAPTRPDKVAELRAELDRLVATAEAVAARYVPETTLAVDTVTDAELSALGYAEDLEETAGER